MLQKALRVTLAPRPLDTSRPDPARDAARLLGWIGLAVLMVGAPLIGVLSRRALFILLPIGAALLIAAFLLTVSNQGIAKLRAALLSPVGLAALFLGGWSGLSLVWTPSPGAAAPSYAAIVAIALLAAVVIVHLPERRARPALYLLPGGLAVTAAATLGMALAGPASFRGGTEFDPSLLERSVLTLVVLVWPTLGALVGFARFRLAAAAAVLVAAVVSLVDAPIAMAVFAIGAVTFALADAAPARTARLAGLVLGALLVVAPALPFVLAPLAAAIPMVGASTVAAMADWRHLVTADGLHLVTGHGLDTARRGVMAGYLPAHTPRTILFEVWYELGILGAVAMAAIVGLGVSAAGGVARPVAPALVAGLVATLAIVVFGVATEELWFVTLASLQAIAFGLVCRSSWGLARPPADRLGRAAEPGVSPVPTGDDKTFGTASPRT